MQALAAGHAVTVLARTPAKLATDVRDRVEVIDPEGLTPGALEELSIPSQRPTQRFQVEGDLPPVHRFDQAFFIPKVVIDKPLIQLRR